MTTRSLVRTKPTTHSHREREKGSQREREEVGRYTQREGGGERDKRVETYTQIHADKHRDEKDGGDMHTETYTQNRDIYTETYTQKEVEGKRNTETTHRDIYRDAHKERYTDTK